VSFESKVAIVTGGSSGIGAATVARLLERGAHVTAADVDVAGVAKDAGDVECDVSDPAAVERLVAGVLERFGRIDILCNNAAVPSTTDVLACTPEEWDRTFAINCRGPFLCTKAVLPTMIEQGGGVIVNTASVAAFVALPNRAAYSATKGALVSFTRQVAFDYAKHGIRCSYVCPGGVDSPWIARLLESTDDPVAAREAIVAQQPLGRLATPEDVAKAIVFLCSDDAELVTGSGLVVDGGLLAG
jgi:NAD(P)-dependent dehydrogenase (short-subunit alcohol dehydrogenase family)